MGRLPRVETLDDRSRVSESALLFEEEKRIMLTLCI
jgi:hypothetical protein